MENEQKICYPVGDCLSDFPWMLRYTVIHIFWKNTNIIDIFDRCILLCFLTSNLSIIL